MLPQTLDKAATAFPRFLHIYCLCMRHFDVACCNETNKQKCLTTKIDVCNAHKGYKAEKDALMKENSAKASKMCVLPLTQLLPLLLFSMMHLI